MDKADEYYLEARNAVLAAVKALDKKCRNFRTADGITFRVTRKTPLRLHLLMLGRWTPGEEGYTSFSFQRDGRVALGGNRKVPLAEAVANRHEPWASRGELEELATQIRGAVPDA